MNIIAATLSIRNALLDARRRTGDDALSASVSIGYFRVERVTYRANGTSVVAPLTGYCKADACIKYLNSLSVSA